MAKSSDVRTRPATLAGRTSRPTLSRRIASRLSDLSFLLCALALLLVGDGLALASEVGAPAPLPLRSPLANPYCAVPTYAVLSLPGQARALLEHDDKPVILIENEVASGAYARFLLAHECCHHERGHLARLAEQRKKRELAWKSGGAEASADPLSGFGSLMSQRQMELDADCCAATLLAARGDEAGLAAAIAAMETYGARPTGPAYPPGLQRALTIKSCAVR